MSGHRAQIQNLDWEFQLLVQFADEESVCDGLAGFENAHDGGVNLR